MEERGQDAEPSCDTDTSGQGVHYGSFDPVYSTKDECLLKYMTFLCHCFSHNSDLLWSVLSPI